MLVILALIATVFIIIIVKYFDDFKCYLRYRKYALNFNCCDGDYPFVGHFFAFIDSPENITNKLRKWNSSKTNYPIYLHRVGPYLSLNVVGPDVVEMQQLRLGLIVTGDYESCLFKAVGKFAERLPASSLAILSPLKHLEKSHLYDFFHLWLGKGLLTSTGNLWHRRRKILTTAFHFAILQDFIAIFNREALRMVEERKNAISGDESSIDITPFIDNVTLRTINETSMGCKLNTETTKGFEYKENIKKQCLSIHQRIFRPWLYNQWIYYHLMPSGIKEKKTTNSIHKFVENIIKQKSENFHVFELPENDEEKENFEYKRKKLAMLDLLLNEKLKKASIDDEGIRDEVNTFMFEGHDTTSACLGFTLMLLACHKEIQNDVYEEVCTILGPNNSREPSYNDLQDLNLMERCIKESLRLYPSVPSVGRILSEDIQTEAGLLPKDIQVHIHIYDIHRNPKFWPNPEVFDPSRFLPENCKDRHPFAYIPFSAGPRNCIGQRFALLEIKSVICYIVRNFILEPIDTPKTIILFQDAVLRAKNGIKIKFVLRNKTDS